MSAEIIQFVPRSLPSDRLRLAMIREARARYQAIFPDEPAKAVDTSPSELNPDNLA